MLRALVAVALVPAAAGAQAGVAETAEVGAAAVVVDSMEVEGARLVYRTIGEGEPLLLLHGYFGTGEAWAPFFDELAGHYRLIVPDLRGHGRSTNPAGRFTHRRAARDMLALLDRLGIDRVKAMGISTGGMTLLHMATTRPEVVEAMVLLGATSYFPEQARAIMRARDPERMAPSRVEAYGRSHSGGVEQARALLRDFHAFADDYDDMNFTRPLLSTITARTLIVHGDRDAFFPVSIPVEQYEAIPEAAFWIVPDGGHVPLIGTERGSRVFLETVLDFLGADPTATGATGAAAPRIEADVGRDIPSGQHQWRTTGWNHRAVASSEDS